MPVQSLVENLRRRPVIVIIVGAGASFDSNWSNPPTDNWWSAQDRPPLTQGLFLDRYLEEFLRNEKVPARSLIAALPSIRGATTSRLNLTTSMKSPAGTNS